MCGRLHQKDGTLSWLETELGDLELPEGVAEWRENFNAAPTQYLWVIRRHPQTGKNVRDRMKWGFLPPWAKTPDDRPQPINAMSETVATNRMFAPAYKKRRCLIPIAEFFEWQQIHDEQGREVKPKQPWAIAMKNKESFALAGIWTGWKDLVTGKFLYSFAILTCRPNPLMAKIHDRMPVIITAPEAAERWLANIEPDPHDLMQPYPDHLMTAWKIGQKVGSPRNNTPDIIDPIDPSDLDN